MPWSSFSLKNSGSCMARERKNKGQTFNRAFFEQTLFEFLKI
jgi:hypothetical protein